VKRLRDERGAVAVLVALLATVLFTSAVMAVDMGNAWARKRAVQKQVDVSAVSAGWMLPMTTSNRLAIADKVAAYLNDTGNRASGQHDVTGAELVDGSPANGEISWLHDDGSPCTDRCTQMRVLSPPAHVDFGLAAVVGVSSTDVQRSAQVKVVSGLPPMSDGLPFWLPSGCGYGPTQADTTQGGTAGATQPASPTPTAAATTAAPATPTPVGTHQIYGSSPLEVSYGGKLTISDYGVDPPQNKATLRAFPPSGDAYVDFSAAPDKKTGKAPAFTVGTELTNTPGVWSVYAVVKSGNVQTYSTNHLTIRVVGAPATGAPSPTATDSGVPTGCVGQDRGNFGQLDSPRADESNAQKAFALNVAIGIDHRFVPYVFPSGVPFTKECAADNSPIGAQLDDVGGRAGDGANCIRGDTGNDGPKTYDGLVAGVGTHPGRLDVANGSTTCPGRSNVTVDGHLLNNDTLSCFLRNGATLADLAQQTGVTQGMLDPAVVRSPRFVWLPVVYATDRAQKGFQPIIAFVPGFITEETQTSPPNDAAGHVNGLEVNGNSVKVLHVFTFNRAALPPDELEDTSDYDDDVGGAIVRLVG
jgi:hypothetical protein